jgi:hypothetical protein
MKVETLEKMTTTSSEDRLQREKVNWEMILCRGDVPLGQLGITEFLDFCHHLVFRTIDMFPLSGVKGEHQLRLFRYEELI